MYKVNLGCGSVFVDSPDWLNLDYVSYSPAVRKANLLSRLPLPDGTATLVYSSHFFEHVPRAMVSGLLRECFRVLQPGGVLRLVVPDLENMVREYLARRESRQHAKADFVVFELIDQCVRSEPGGELGRFYRQIILQEERCSEMIEYVRRRTGEDLPAIAIANRQGNYSPRRFIGVLWGHVVRAWIQLWCLCATSSLLYLECQLCGSG
ncbi:class I SAM-dependent methyltransferase [Thermosynechococcus vestitus]|uniref:Tlr2387 protein n=1 Tax=Thermosynechococcus vestitus (strain NIES-2133 / IAM M-273 / BP-1) TaxID=197221 RepID=Q8DGD1_THEVB|nr:methyltransferase domain-containing protein [Thermosynechococcus vestitus]BAC09939.1 tlr2387 [Thermosynechococcus vestitus BP-1]